MTPRAQYTGILAGFAAASMLVLAAVLFIQFHHASTAAREAGVDALERTLTAEYQRHGALLARSFASRAVQPLHRNDMPSLDALVREIGRDPDVRQVLVFDDEGRVVHDGRDALGAARATLHDLSGGRAALADGLLIQEGDDALDITHPVHIGDARLGGVRLLLSTEDVSRAVAAHRADLEAMHAAGVQQRLFLLAGSLLAVVIGAAAMASALAARMNGAVASLAQAARDIADGREPAAQSHAPPLAALDLALGDMQAQWHRTHMPRANLARIMGGLNEALLVTDAQGNITLVNAAAAHLLGQAPEELAGTPVAALFEGESPPTLADVAGHGGEIVHFPDSALHRADGSVVPISLAAVVLADSHPGFAFVARDLREHLDHAQERRLADSVFMRSSEGIVVCDTAGQVRRVNPAFLQLTGLRAEDLEGQSLATLAGAQTAEGDGLSRVMDTLVREDRWEGEIWYQRAGGGINPLWLSASAVLDAEGRVEHFMAVFIDLRALKDAEKRIHHLAYFDSLTNLPNRMLFQDRLQQALTQAQRHGELVALLFIDLDRFKVINDTKGHAFGDRLLKHVAQRLRTALRDEDTVSRIGGDEFAIIAPGLHDAEDANTLAQKVLGLFTPPFIISDEKFFTAASIGLSLFPIDAREPEALIANADAAMFRAKEHGRSVYRFFTPDMNDRVAEAMEIEHGLRQALERNELSLYYQPQFDLRSGEAVGVEALLRWTNRRLGHVPPAVFIPVAEDCGLIGAIGEWMIREACHQASDWRRRGLAPIRMAVNLSGRQFADPRLLAQIEGALAASDLDPKALEVEITESVVMTDLDRSVATLMRLNELGVRIAVDDFGTGYSSLSYLKRFPLHALKIDRSFIRDVMDDPDDAAITGAIINMGHSLGLTVIAEGVENTEHESFLRAHECDLAQGYFYGRAVSAGEVEGMLSRRLLPAAVS